MRRSLIPLAVVTSALLVGSAPAANYNLVINGKTYEIDLDSQQLIRLPGGQTVKVELKKKAIVTYKVDRFSFDHSSVLTPSRSDLGSGIHQNMVTTPLGTLIIIQEYEGLDPTGQVEMMLGAMIEDETRMGIPIKKSGATKQLANGTKLTGRRAEYKGNDDDVLVEVYAMSRKGFGLLIVTQIDRTNPDSESQLHQLFWKTLSVAKR